MNTLDPAKPSGVWQTLLPWFARGSRWTKPLGEMADQKIQAAIDAVKLRFPELTPDERSLAILGRDRKLPRAPGEPPESYARRLILWLDLWGLAGQPLGLLYALQSFIFPGYPMVRYVEYSNLWYTLDEAASVALTPFEAASLPATGPQRYVPPVGIDVSPRAKFWMHQGSNWDWHSISHADEQPRWWDYWLIVYPPSYSFQGDYDDNVFYDTDTCWGLDVDPGTIATLRELIRLYERSGSHCAAVIFPPDISAYSPDGVASPPEWPDGMWGWEVKDDGMGGSMPTKSLNNRYLLGFQ